jgi:hypothetical protein
MKSLLVITLICLATTALGGYVAYQRSQAPATPTASSTVAAAPPVAPTATSTTPPANTAVRVNGVALEPSQLAQLQAKYRVPIAPGNYWYDARNGLWGSLGGPAQGVIMSGEPIGGPLAGDSSGQGTNVFINGRELHPTDVQNLDALFAAFGTRTQPGRYWSNANGDFGADGSLSPLGNFRAMVAQAQRARGSSYYKNNPWSYTTDYTAFGGDGSSSYFESKKTYGADQGTTGVYIDESGVSYDTPTRSE